MERALQVPFSPNVRLVFMLWTVFVFEQWNLLVCSNEKSISVSRFAAEFLVLTVATKDNDGFRRFMDSADHYDIPVEVRPNSYFMSFQCSTPQTSFQNLVP